MLDAKYESEEYARNEDGTIHNTRYQSHLAGFRRAQEEQIAALDVDRLYRNENVKRLAFMLKAHRTVSEKEVEIFNLKGEVELLTKIRAAQGAMITRQRTDNSEAERLRLALQWLLEQAEEGGPLHTYINAVLTKTEPDQWKHFEIKL